MPTSDSAQSVTLDSLIQISSGNIPSQVAHTMQIVKMAEVFSEKIEQFELITSGDIWSFLTRQRLDLNHWYGLRHPFHVTQIPLRLRQKYPFPEHYYGGIPFYLLAVLYTLLKKPSLAYTRTPGIVKLLVKANMPVIWELHEFPNKDTVFQSTILAHPCLVGFVTTSPKIGEVALEKGLPIDKLLIEPNAVDLQKFLPYQSKDVARRIVGFSDTKPTIVYTGHLHDHKGIPTILEMANIMPSYNFILVGGWEHDVSKVQECCQQRNLTNVRLIGHVPQSQLPNYLYAADVLLLPTSQYWDQSQITSPLKLFDYMAARRPLVASALPNIKALICDGVNGLLAEPDHAPSFKDAIEKLLNDTRFSEHLAQQAFEDIQLYTWEKRADRILKFAKERLSISFP